MPFSKKFCCGRVSSLYLRTLAAHRLRPLFIALSAMSQFENVSVLKKANVYFGGQCISHTVLFADGSKKSVGVILPSQLTFGTQAAEVMELIEGRCRVRLKGEPGWKDYTGGQSFAVPANSSFEIETLDALHYVCHFG